MILAIAYEGIFIDFIENNRNMNVTINLIKRFYGLLIYANLFIRL